MSPRLPGIRLAEAIRALEKVGFQVVRQNKHVFLRRGNAVVILPHSRDVDPYIMAAAIRKAGLSIEQFRELL